MISFKPEDVRRFNAAINRLRRIVTIQKEDFPMKSAVDYANRLSYNISTQKFAPSYPPYSYKYQLWKEKYYPGSIGFWHLRGYLLKNIKPFKVPQGWFAGIDGSAMAPAIYGGRQVRISDYGYYMEYGRRRRPARPLFNPTLDEFENEGWSKLATEVQSKMKGAWR